MNLRRLPLPSPLLLGLLAFVCAPAVIAAPSGGTPNNPWGIRPYPRDVVATEVRKRWDFRGSTAGWSSISRCRLRAGDEFLTVAMDGFDPYFGSPPIRVGNVTHVRMRLRCRGVGGGQIYWATAREPNMSEARVTRFDLIHDNEWHDYNVALPLDGTMTLLRLDPGENAGEVDLAWVELRREFPHPLELQWIRNNEGEVHAQIENHSDAEVGVRLDGRRLVIAPKETHGFVKKSSPRRSFDTVCVRLTEIESAGADLPGIERCVSTHRTATKSDGWLRLEAGNTRLEVAPNGLGARVFWKNRLAGIFSPLANGSGPNGRGIPLDVELRAGRVVCRGGVVRKLELWIEEDDAVGFRLTSDGEVDGPAMQVIGALEQGLLSGVEYLGRGEASSSRLDIELAEHVRFAPKKRWLTAPLMAFVTSDVSVALEWDDTRTQPIFATPNFLDATPHHRINLRGTALSGRFVVGPGWSEKHDLTNIIEAHVRRRALPKPPAPPRDRDGQFALCRHALEGPLRSDQGWGHCVGVRWPRRFYASHASTLFRLTGALPKTPNLVQGGVHVANPAAYLLAGRARRWLDELSAEAQRVKQEQRPDGSFRYDGKFRRGHFEDTASGYCAMRVVRLLDHAWYTGNQESLRAGTRALGYLRRFRTPRGAQTWEVPLHTPDILGAAHLIAAYLRGFQLTGDPAYLADARRWALSGLPFVYLWADRPIMLYATTPVFGATNWEAPNWIELPVQWCGLSYAYALADLSLHDQSFPWKTISTGILYAAEQMQYTEGPSKGCLPDAFELDSQLRRPADINPCVLVALRLKLEGALDSVDFGANDRYRVVAPFPIELDGSRISIRSGTTRAFEIVVNGAPRPVDSTSAVDRIDLSQPR